MLRKDQRGITFVELLIAIAISAIIFGAATYFLGSAHKGYNYASASIDLQSESQVLMEQIGMWVMEGNRIEVSPGGDKIQIYQIPRKVTTALPDGVPAYDTKATKRVIWISGGTLYTKQIGNIDDADSDTTDVSSSDEMQEHCIGEYVSSFSATVSAGGAKVTIVLELKEGTQTYKIEDDFKVRNKVM